MKYALIGWLTLGSMISAEEPDPAQLFQKGDRVVILGNTYADQLRSHGYFEAMLASRAADLQLTFRNLAWPGDTLTLRPRPLNFGSLDEHLQKQKADVILVCFGMNEAFKGSGGLEQFKKSYQRFLQRLQSKSYNGKTPPRIVLVSPIAREPDERFANTQKHSQSLKEYANAIESVAKQRKVGFVDLYTPTAKLYEETRAHRLTKNGIHLNDYGYWSTSHFLGDELISNPEWKVEVDATNKSATVSGAKVSSIQTTGNGIRFTLEDAILPVPPSPKGPDIHLSLTKKQRRLVVTNLASGTYTLKINGKEIASGNHNAWAKGVMLHNTPAAKRAEQLRRAILEKNQLFLHRWRPANTEYVFGRRTKPFGSVSFPPEMKKLDQLIAEKEKEIQKLARPSGPEQWHLSK